MCISGITGPRTPYTRGALMHFVVPTFFTRERDFPETAHNRLRLPGFDHRSTGLPSLSSFSFRVIMLQNFSVTLSSH